MENMNILMGKPVKAFAVQDHQAHLQVHMAAQQDPMIMAIVGQNPQAQAIMAAMEAHKAEHVGFEYRNQMAQVMGVQLSDPDSDEPLPPEVEAQLSRAMAQAAPQILARSKAMAAQQQAQKNAQDPVLQAELIDQQVKQGELQRKKDWDVKNYDLLNRKLIIEAQQKGVDPTTLQLDQASKVHDIEQSAAQAQQDAAIKNNQAQTNDVIARRRAATQTQSEGIRLAAELKAKRDAERRAQEQHDLNQGITAERAAEQKRQSEEKHKADLKARAQAAAQAKISAAKPQEKK
jgi:hypothetical protein